MTDLSIDEQKVAFLAVLRLALHVPMIDWNANTSGCYWVECMRCGELFCVRCATDEKRSKTCKGAG